MSGSEFAATFDATTGADLGEIVAVGSSEVDVGQHIRAMVPGRRYVTVHTHPASTPPSSADAEVLVANAAIRAVIVVGADGTWYALGREAGRPVTVETLRTMFFAALYVLRPRFIALGRAQGLGRDQIVVALLDEIWRTITSRLRLRYDRWKS